MKERQVWIDMLKGYGIVMVTIGHLGIAFPLEKHIYSYHMFLFFLISGYLFVDRPFTETLKKKTNSLLAPFLAWDLVSNVIGAVMYHQSFKSFIATLFILKGNLCFNAPIWFLLILFFTEIIYSYINDKIVINNGLLIFISMVVFLLVGTIQLPLKVNLLPLAMFSYATGALIKKREILGGYLTYIVLIALALISVAFGMFLNSRISYTTGDFGNMLFCIIAAYSGMLFFFALFRLLFRGYGDNILSYIGKNSFSIMVMQYYFFTLYYKVCRMFFGIEDIWHMANSAKAILLATLTIFLILLIVGLFRKMSKGTMLEKIGNLFGI